jgi:hypothetical protein
MNMPGFTAEQALKGAHVEYLIKVRSHHLSNEEAIIPQFNEGGLVNTCALLWLAILGGQIQWIPVFFSFCLNSPL